MSYAPISIKASIYTGHEEFLRTRGNPARVEINPNNNITPILPAKYQDPHFHKSTIAFFAMLMKKRDISGMYMADVVELIQTEEKDADIPVRQNLFSIDPTLLSHFAFPKGSYIYKKLSTRFSNKHSCTASGKKDKNGNFLGLHIKENHETDILLDYVPNDFNTTWDNSRKRPPLCN